MQTITITSDFIFSNACTKEMLFELATSPFCSYSQQAAEKLYGQALKQGSTATNRKSQASGDLPGAKLRTCIVNKLQNNGDIAESFKAGAFQFEMQHLADEQPQAEPEPDINAAGTNKQRRASSGPRQTATGPLQGAYEVVKKGVKCTEETDAGKWEIWQHVWNCTSFEQYFAQAPAKGVTKTGRVITARSEMQWAVKSGWIKPVAAEQQ